MALDPRTPVVVGVGQLTRKPTVDDLDGIGDPVAMMAEAARLAAADSGAADPAKLLRGVSSVRVVEIMSWRLQHPGRGARSGDRRRAQPVPTLDDGRQQPADAAEQRRGRHSRRGDSTRCSSPAPRRS